MRRWITWLALPALMLMVAAGDPMAPSPRPRAPGWMQRHEDKLAELRQGPVGMIFLGDSITQELESTNPAWGNINAVWQRFYACRQAVNLGYNGDTTANLLWRIENGEVDGIHPRLAVVMVGTNNIRPKIVSSADETAGAIIGVIGELHRRLPATPILLLGLPPSGRPPANEAERRQVNAMLGGHDWRGQNVSFQDIDEVFQPGGTLDTSLYRQGTIGRAPVHPNAQGWEKLAEAIEPGVRERVGACR